MTETRLRMLERLLWRWVELVRRRPRTVLAGVIASGAVCAAVAAGGLSVNTDTREMISNDEPFRQAEQRFDREFPNLKNAILVVVEAATLDEADAYSAALVERLQGAEAIRDVFAPAVDPFFVENGLLFLSEQDLNDRLDRLNKAAPLLGDLVADPSLDTYLSSLARSVKIADRVGVDDPVLDRALLQTATTLRGRMDGTPQAFSWQALFTEPGEGPARRLITVAPEFDFDAIQPAKAALVSIRAAIAEARADGTFDVEVGVTGMPVLRFEELQSVSRGIGLSFAVSLVVVSVLLVVAFRSFPMVGVSLLVLVLSLVVTAGLSVVLVGPLNLVSVAFVVLLVGLGIDFVIHLGLHLRECQDQGLPLRRGLALAMHEIGAPLVLAATTTSLAFFAFIPTRFAGMAQLGIISGVGVIVAFAMATTVVPAFMALVGAPQPNPLRSVLAARRAGRRPLRALLAVGLVATALLCLPLLPQVRFDADPMALRNPESPSVQTFNALFDQQRTAPYRLHLIRDSVEEAEAVAGRLEALPEVKRALVLSDFLPGEDQEITLEMVDLSTAGLAAALATGHPRKGLPGDGAVKLEEALAAVSTPARVELRAALADYRRARASNPALAGAVEADLYRFWPFQLDRMRRQLRPDWVSVEDLPAPLRSRYLSDAGRYRVEIVSSLDLLDLDARRRFIEAVETVDANPAGPARSVLKAGDVVSRSMLQASITALVIVTAVLWITLRKASLVGVILAPLVVAGVLTSAAGVLLGLPYNYANVIVLPLLIGLGVDSGIHLALRRLRRRAGFESIYDTTTARAVLFSGLTTVASFGSLALSEHRGTASMGLLLMIAVAVTLLCTLVLVPVALGFTEPPLEASGEPAQQAESASPAGAG